MIEALNTLFVTTQRTRLRLERETIRIETPEVEDRRIPFHHLAGIVLFGNVSVSPFLIHRCADDGRPITFLTETGRFKARLEGPMSGNVLLRRSQHRASETAEFVLGLARRFVAGKLQNQRAVLLRAAREAEDDGSRGQLQTGADALARTLGTLPSAADLDAARGAEGYAARAYFSAFPALVRRNREAFPFGGRERRPPRDPVNALLSFLYALLAGDCRSAVESVGLDPQIGFLHALRPGRPALALDLMEEFRPLLADRVAVTLINRQELRPTDFESRPGGAVILTESGRRTVIAAYQTRKREAIAHPALAAAVPLGLVIHVQARLLARHVRGDLERYDPFTPR